MKKILDEIKATVPKKTKRIPNWGIQEQQAMKSSFYKGYKIMPQKYTHTHNKRIDIFAVNKNNSSKRKAGEVKDTQKARLKDVRQILIAKKYPLCATEVALYYNRDTIIPQNVRDYAQEKNVKIIRTRLTKTKERQPGVSGFFKPKKYLM